MPAAPDPDDARHGPARAEAVAYGGQAVLEGVMMRGPEAWSVAVRRPDGDIWLERHPITPRPPGWRRLPLVRGTFALADSLRIGTRALKVAADQALADDPRAPQGGVRLGPSIALAALGAVTLFVLVPTAATAGADRLLGGVLGDGVAFHLVESLLRVALFLGYLVAVGRQPDIRRTFAYHGAEHQTIAAHEHGARLTPDEIRRFPTRHVRCGTNFLVQVLVLAIVVLAAAGALVPPPEGIGLAATFAYHVALRLVLLPLIAGVAYEVLKLGARAGDHPLVRVLVAPGLWLQAITTRPPSAEQAEVAIRAFTTLVGEGTLGDRGPGPLPSPVRTPADAP